MGSVATSIAALGNGSVDGQIGHIRVSQGGESLMLKLFWDAVASKWVSDRFSTPIESNDGDWTNAMNMPKTDWAYWGNASSFGRWALRAGSIPFCGALIAAGLQLQDRMSARMSDAGSAYWLSPWFYEFDADDLIVFSNDQGPQATKTWNGHADLGFQPSPENIGHGAVLKTDGSSTVKLYGAAQYDDGITGSGYHSLTRQPGWDYVKFFKSSLPSGNALGGVPTTTPHTPTKKYLYPTLYGIAPSGAVGAAAIQYECRWSS